MNTNKHKYIPYNIGLDEITDEGLRDRIALEASKHGQEIDIEELKENPEFVGVDFVMYGYILPPDPSVGMFDPIVEDFGVFVKPSKASEMREAFWFEEFIDAKFLSSLLEKFTEAYIEAEKDDYEYAQEQKAEHDFESKRS